jgi:hypothetical protein
VKDGVFNSRVVKGDYFISKFPESLHDVRFWDSFSISQVWEYEYPDSTVGALDLYFNIQTDFFFMQILDGNGNEVFYSIQPEGYAGNKIRVPGNKFSVVVGLSTAFFGTPSTPASYYGFKIDNIVPIGGVLSAIPHGGVCNSPQTVTLVSTYPEIFYTLDGSTPNRTSARYIYPINITENTMLRAVGFNGTNYSYIHENVYYITLPPESLHNMPGWFDASWEFDFSDLNIATPIEILFDERSQIDDILIYTDKWACHLNSALPSEIKRNQSGQPYLHVTTDYLNIQYLSGFSDAGDFGFKVNKLDIPEVTRFSAPTISLDGTRLAWEADGNTTEIHIYANGFNRTSIRIDEPFFDLRFLNLPVGPYQIQVRARNWRGNFALSELSEAVTFVSTGEAPPQFIAPSFSIYGHTLSWNLVEGAQSYGIYVNGVNVSSYWETSGTTASRDLNHLNLSNGTYQIQLRTGGRHGVANRSELSSAVPYIQDLALLSTPVISLDGTRLTWEADNNANRLSIYVNRVRVGGCCCWLRLSYFDLRFFNLNTGTHQIQVRVEDSNGNFIMSRLSEAVTFVSTRDAPPQFDAPDISIDNHTVSWTLVENSRHYSVYVNRVRVVSGWGVSNNPIQTLDLRYLNLPNGTHQVQVRIDGWHGIANRSGLSNIVTYVQELPQLTVPAFNIDGARLTWEADGNATAIRIYANGSHRASVSAGEPFFDLPSRQDRTGFR